jgi:hypothetical protein
MTKRTLLTEEILQELVSDFENDEWLHPGLVFNNWRQRHQLRDVKIADVSYLLNGKF